MRAERGISSAFLSPSVMRINRGGLELAQVLGLSGAFSLTPALSRWERENRIPRQIGSPSTVVAASAALGKKSPSGSTQQRRRRPQDRRLPVQIADLARAREIELQLLVQISANFLEALVRSDTDFLHVVVAIEFGDER